LTSAYNTDGRDVDKKGAKAMTNAQAYMDARNYFGDSRVRAGHRAEGSLLRHVDKARMQAVFELEDDDGEEREYRVPVKYRVCPTCRGAGTHVNPSVDAGGLTAADFDEDPDFAEDYLGGCYDVTCYECGGERVVAVVDRKRADKAVLKLMDRHDRAADLYRQEVAAERAMGA